ncbi:hypothetical protein Pelo_13227 [Pelomyxa schiedti]|nr:hypothetical protein Pelo_13227 [Pelomyxa schiedti]
MLYESPDSPDDARTVTTTTTSTSTTATNPLATSPDNSNYGTCTAVVPKQPPTTAVPQNSATANAATTAATTTTASAAAKTDMSGTTHNEGVATSQPSEMPAVVTLTESPPPANLLKITTDDAGLDDVDRLIQQLGMEHISSSTRQHSSSPSSSPTATTTTTTSTSASSSPTSVSPPKGAQPNKLIDEEQKECSYPWLTNAKASILWTLHGGGGGGGGGGGEHKAQPQAERKAVPEPKEVSPLPSVPELQAVLSDDLRPISSGVKDALEICRDHIEELPVVQHMLFKIATTKHKSQLEKQQQQQQNQRPPPNEEEQSILQMDSVVGPLPSVPGANNVPPPMGDPSKPLNNTS